MITNSVMTLMIGCGRGRASLFDVQTEKVTGKIGAIETVLAPTH